MIEGLEQTKKHIDHVAVEAEELADNMRERERDRKQMEMYASFEDNWSGNRWYAEDY